MTYDEVKVILTNYIDRPGSYCISIKLHSSWSMGYWLCHIPKNNTSNNSSSKTINSIIN